MSVAMDSADGLLFQALIKSYISNHSTDSNRNDSTHMDGMLCATSFLHSTPQNHSSSGSTPPSVFMPSSSRSTPPSKSTSHCFDPSPTQLRTPHAFSSSKSSSCKPSSRRSISPILNLAKIDEKELLQTPSQLETSDPLTNLNIPETLITSATPPINENTAETNQNKGAPILTQHQIGSDLDQNALRVPTISFPLLLNRSLGLESPGIGSPSPRNISKIRRADITFGKLIGKGGFGSVHAASIGDRPVAVKIVQKRRGSGIHREILQAERLAFKLNLRHENIVAIFGVNMCEELRGDALIVMELVTSQSLQALLDDAKWTVDVQERLNYALQVARALQYLHNHNVAHLDVKPANVLMTSAHVCKLSDFGSLTLTGSQCRKEEPEFTQLLGTLPYRAPELMTGVFPSTKADIYSYGIILWQMLTRESPHHGANPHALIYQVVKWDLRPSVPDIGNDVIEMMYNKLYTSCWSRDMEERPDASDIIPAVQRIVDSLS